MVNLTHELSISASASASGSSDLDRQNSSSSVASQSIQSPEQLAYTSNHSSKGFALCHSDQISMRRAYIHISTLLQLLTDSEQRDPARSLPKAAKTQVILANRDIRTPTVSPHFLTLRHSLSQEIGPPRQNSPMHMELILTHPCRFTMVGMKLHTQAPLRVRPMVSLSLSKIGIGRAKILNKNTGLQGRVVIRSLSNHLATCSSQCLRDQATLTQHSQSGL